LPVPSEKIAGTAFFPGGAGLYLKDRDQAIIKFPVDGVMVLGHNFDSEIGFYLSAKNGKESLSIGTWGPLLNLLTDAKIPFDRCFFTNAFMGLCEGENSFDYRGREHSEFRQACLAFLKAQIEIQRPRLIITLGLHVPSMIAELSADLDFWIGRKLKLKDIDLMPIVRKAAFRLSSGLAHCSVLVPIAHPSLPNNRRRKPIGWSAGRVGEIEIVRDGWRE
jgi:hypothetical protein